MTAAPPLAGVTAAPPLAPTAPGAVLVYGAAEAVHDYHAGAGGFTAACAALAAAAPPVVVETPLTRSSYRALAPLPVWLRSRGVAAWRLRVLAWGELPAEAASRTVPRLAMALPHALHAATRARALGLAVAIVDAPRCLLGPLADALVITAPRVYAGPCDGCAARARCGGVDDAYLTRFGAGELAPPR